MKTEEIFKSASSVYCVGIKGTGVCALAELMHNTGIKVTGSDTSEIFYTDKILKELNIPFYENFDASRIKEGIDVIIHSPAYSADSNPELARAIELDIPVLGYPQALGAWSSNFNSTGVCGVHGKTTTAAMCGICAKAAGLPAQILTGSAAFDFGGRSTLDLGNKYFIAETCEYREHFLSFHPARIILTSVEIDHQDYFETYESIRSAFVRYCRLLPEGGTLIYCADDAGASETAEIIVKEKPDIELIPYGFTSCGDYKITSFKVESGTSIFTLAGSSLEFKLKIPGLHEALNAAAAIALTASLERQESGADFFLNKEKISAVKNALENFKSTKRRSEIIGDACGILFMDDYAHHPSAVKTTLSGIKSFYPNQRLIVSFMSHTYTRTSALLEEFAGSFNDADILFLHKIYASARENYKGGVNGRTLYEKALKIRGGETYYADEPDGAFSPLCEILKEGDVFITLGAGNNWPLAEKLYAHYREISHD